MSGRDTFHSAVKNALIKDDWMNVAPLTLRYDDTRLEIDLGAEQFFSAQKDAIQIVVEVKSFITLSLVYEFHQAIGQYIHYRMVLESLQPKRIPYLGLPIAIYDRFFQSRFFRDSLEKNQVNLLLVDTLSEEIIQWLPKPSTLDL
jgi:XisH protein